MQMIVGLGNPGKSYEKNRHNVGFQCADVLAARHGLRIDQTRGRARVALATIQLVVPAVVAPDGEGEVGAARQLSTSAYRVVLAKPQTFMNAVGQSVAALARFYKIAPAEILVIFDDLDLPLGSLRLRASGGSGGHNGMKSIIRELGTDQFPRLRVGIDRPPGRMDPADYVLQDFSPAQEEVMALTRPRVADACEAWLAYGIVAAMNAYN